MADRETLNVYAAQAGKYASLTTDAATKDDMLVRFIAQMPKGGTVLDLGCGPGVSAGAMAAAGLNAHAWDPVPEMIALATAHSGVTTRQAGFEQLDSKAVYDGIWANFSLLHAPRDHWPSHLGAIAKALRPNGLFHVAIKTGTGEKRDRLGRRYAYETEEGLTALLVEAGLAPEHTAQGRDTGLDGAPADWIAVQARA